MYDMYTNSFMDHELYIFISRKRLYLNLIFFLENLSFVVRSKSRISRPVDNDFVLGRLFDKFIRT